MAKKGTIRLESQHLLEWLLLGYFCMLAAFGKHFSYLHLQLGPLPLYVGELALAMGLGVVFLQRRHLVWKELRSAWIALVAFLSIGLLGTILSFAKGLGEPVQILRDSALYYQSAWVFYGATIDSKKWQRLLWAIFLGCALAQINGWLVFLHQGRPTELGLEALGHPSGNELVTPLLPLAMSVLPARSVFGLSVLYGHTFLGQVLYYLKRSWWLTFVIFALPAALFSIRKRSERYTRLGALVGGWGVGMGLALLTAGWVVQRSGLEPWPYLGQLLRDVLFNLDKWVLHGEVHRHGGKGVQGIFDYIFWRRHLWLQAWDGFLQAPWLGNGFGPHVVTHLVWGQPAVHDGRWISGPHNSFLTVLFRMGVVGALPLLALIGLAGYRGILRWLASGLGHASIGPAAAFCSAVAFALFNVCLENPQAGNFFWLFLGIWLRTSGEKS